MLPDELRTCLHAVRSPAPLGHIIGTAALRVGYDAERQARLTDEAAAIDCAHKLGAVVDLVDAFNAEHGSH